MKRIVIGCDGTWQDLETPDPTNVRLLCQAVAPADDDGVEQLVHYQPGIGTRSAFSRITGGAFGIGINVEIATAYTFLCANYRPGDEIYLFGFSRGAYTVRSLAGLIYSCGILRREELSWLPNAYALYRNLDTPDREDLALRLQKLKGHGQTTEDPDSSIIRISYLGVWDTVGALGIPDVSRLLRLDRRSQNKHRFHNTYLSPIVDYARHAVAVDERRKLFRHTEMNPLPGVTPRSDQVRQVWFPGDHGCVGGGGDGLPEGDPDKVNTRPLSDAALVWMVEELATRSSTLKINREQLGLQEDPLLPFPKDFSKGFNRRLSDPLRGTQPKSSGRDRRPFCDFGDLHTSLVSRWQGDTDYRPRNVAEAHGSQLG